MAEDNEDLTLEKGKGKGKKVKEGDFDATAMLEKHGKKGTIVTFTDRIECIVIDKKNTFYEVGQIIEPHKIVAEELIELGIAKKYVKPEDE